MMVDYSRKMEEDLSLKDLLYKNIIITITNISKDLLFTNSINTSNFIKSDPVFSDLNITKLVKSWDIIWENYFKTFESYCLRVDDNFFINCNENIYNRLIELHIFGLYDTTKIIEKIKKVNEKIS